MASYFRRKMCLKMDETTLHSPADPDTNANKIADDSSLDNLSAFRSDVRLISALAFFIRTHKAWRLS